MEEKKLDLNSIIGFVLISGILMWMLYSNAPTKEEAEAKAKQEQIDKQKEDASKIETAEQVVSPVVANDSLKNEQAKVQLSSFAY